MAKPTTNHFLVYEGPGPNWDRARPRREQDHWEAHAAFMDALVEDGFLLLGGPVDATHAVLLVNAPDEPSVRARLSPDPWKPLGILQVDKIARWEILLDSRGRR